MMGRAMEGSFVAVLFCGLAGSASRFGREGDEQADAARRAAFTALRGAIAAHGGREVRSTGDGLMVAFGSAVAAMRCAVAMQRAAPSPLSIGLDAGEPLPDGDDLYGTPVIVAERLCDAAGPGEILASEVVCRIAAPRLAEPLASAGALRLRDVSERIAASQVLWRDDAAGPRRARAGDPRRSTSSSPTTSGSCAPACG